MSSPQPPHASPAPHLDVETLADLQEGLLDADRVPAAVEHLDGCAECQATRDSLDAVRGLLGDHGAEGPVAAPDDVVRRIDEALATALPAVAGASATVVPLTTLPRAGRSPWHTRALQAAAVFVLVAAVGGIGYGGIRAMSNRDDATAGSAAGSAGSAATEKRAGVAGRYPTTNSGRDYTQASLVAAVPELLAGSLPHVGEADSAPADSAPADSAPATSPPAAAPTRSTTASSSGPTTAPVAPGRLRDGAALAACVANLANGPVTPLAVDFGRFDGKPATIIVLPDPKDPSFVNVYAVEPACAAGTFLDWEHVALP